MLPLNEEATIVLCIVGNNFFLLPLERSFSVMFLFYCSAFGSGMGIYVLSPFC